MGFHLTVPRSALLGLGLSAVAVIAGLPWVIERPRELQRVQAQLEEMRRQQESCPFELRLRAHSERLREFHHPEVLQPGTVIVQYTDQAKTTR
jgi:hypothetical protein